MKNEKIESSVVPSPKNNSINTSALAYFKNKVCIFSERPHSFQFLKEVNE